MEILLTGAAGFIGMHVVQRLLEDNGYGSYLPALLNKTLP